jgi:choloylglycine hydrolase
MKFLFSFLQFLSFFALFPCTDFLLVSEDEVAIKGRTLDFAFPLECALYIFPKKSSFKTTDPEGNTTISWKNKYSFASIGLYNPENLKEQTSSSNDFDGINEVGLTIEALWHLEANYPKPTPNEFEKSFSIGDFSDYILGMCSNLDEVKEFLSSYIFWFKPSSQVGGGMPTIHFMISDSTNKSIVCEFIDEKLVIYDNVPNLIANSPSYGWHLENLRNYVGKSNIDLGSYKFKDFNVKSTSHGNGLYGIPGDFTSPSRFIKTFLLSSFSNPKTKEECLASVQSILSNVIVPLGPVKDEINGNIIYDYTQWILLKDITNKVLYFKTYSNLNFLTLDLTDLWNKKKYQEIKL